MQTKEKPIGVFDSGLGGLTVVKKLIEQLPNEDIVYFGDTARVPYGDRSRETILEYTRQDMAFLLSQDVKAVCIACNTADSMARTEMEKLYTLPIVGAVLPAAKTAVRVTLNRKIGVIGTHATVASGAYKNSIASLDPACTVYSVACPLLVPLVEEGRFHKGDAVTESVLADYLAPLREKGIDTIILGCTHYPLLYDMVASLLPGVFIICSGFASVDYLKNELAGRNLLNDRQTPGKTHFLVSDAPEKFAANASLFLGRPIGGQVKKVSVGQGVCD